MSQQKQAFVAAAVAIAFVMAAVMVAAAEKAKQPWQELYTGANAFGKNVICLWQFLPGNEAADNSGNGHKLKLRGETRFVKDGRFGSCIEVFRTEKDTAEGAIAARTDDLSPEAAFTLELWIKPKLLLEKHKQAHLLDKMYIPYKHSTPTVECQRDYMLLIQSAARGKARLVARLGFGDAVVTYTSDIAQYEVGRWHHAAFTYDGAGAGRFYLNGTAIGRGSHPGRKSILAGKYPLVIGDRSGSSFAAFSGFIDQVRISRRIVKFTPME